MKKPTISRVWKYVSAESFIFPEMTDRYQLFFNGKSDYGICFSGGGTRSATCTVGQLRGLHSINVLERSKYIASNSGGTWGSLPYIYIEDEDLEGYFGSYTPPEELTEDLLYKVDHGDSFFSNVIDAQAVKKTLHNERTLGLGDESYSQAIADIFFRPHKDRLKNRFFTLNEESLEGIIQHNYQVSPSDFVKVAKGRPFHIANGTLHNRFIKGKNPSKDDESKSRKFHVEMTPLYAGVKVDHKKMGEYGSNIGGGYVEPFAFDSKFDGQPSLQELPLDKRDNLPLVKIKYPNEVNVDSLENMFTLADVMGVSGSAPTSFDPSVKYKGKKTTFLKRALKKLAVHKIAKLSDGLIGGVATKTVVLVVKGIAHLVDSLPEMFHFSPLDIDEESIIPVEYNIGDGGPVDDIALMPLLARKVPKIICFCNVQTKVISKKQRRFKFENLDKDVLSLFGVKKIKRKSSLKNIKNRGFQQVFDSGDLDKMKSAFTKAFKNGEPLVYEGEHKVIGNTHFGIPASKEGQKVKILWIYNERSKMYEDIIKQSNPGLSKKLRIGKRGTFKANKLKNFPNFKTFLENRLRVIEMFPVQANLLANYHTWIIKKNESRIKNFLEL